MTEAASPPPASDSCTASQDWKSALAGLVTSRWELLRLESKDASRSIIRSLVLLAIIAFATCVAWICLMTGIVGLVTYYTTVAWWAVALILFVLHVIAAFLSGYLLSKKSPAVFPLTKTEFQKDQLWLQSLKSPKSKN